MATNTYTNVIQSAQSGLARRLRETGITRMDETPIVRFLGWFSIGFGAAELFAPELVARVVGTRRNHRTLIRSYGLRELAAGVGILTQRRPAAWLWARVAGDAVDLVSLGMTAASPRNERGRTAAAIGAVAGVTALDIICAHKLSGEAAPSGRVEANLAIDASPEECYRFWRNFENLPRFMEYLDSVRITGERRSHWVARSMGDVRVEWDAEVVDDVPGRRIAWQSIGGGDVCHSGSVEFEQAPGGRGTVVRVQMSLMGWSRFLTPGIARVTGMHPEQLVYKDLRRFKQVLETGEAITTEGQPVGRRSGATWLDRLAR